VSLSLTVGDAGGERRDLVAGNARVELVECSFEQWSRAWVVEHVVDA
jgi:hypothetical protein